ncbi:MAG TPA: contact-dependent growth inhibition system immunity protein [Nitrospiria bacterium]|nr:contact-dependent growth inhibition system immunity protein [Nitrospiria bacterium]
MRQQFDLTKTLEELESVAWDESNYDSHLVQTCHNLRRKPVGRFSIEDHRIMIGQNIGVQFLVPIAIEKLQTDPLSEGDFYPGDLLAVVLRIEPIFWKQEPGWKTELKKILDRLGPIPKELADAVRIFREGAV